MKKSLLASAIGLVALTSNSAFAASSGDITFSGEITSNSCVINVGDTNKTVTLPTVSTNAFAAAGDTAGATSFSIGLTGCNAGNVAVGFSLQNNIAYLDADQPQLVKNTGSATNVAIAIYDGFSTNQIDLSQNSAKSQTVAISASGEANIPLAAAYYAKSATVGAGDVSGYLKYEIWYQ